VGCRIDEILQTRIDEILQTRIDEILQTRIRTESSDLRDQILQTRIITESSDHRDQILQTRIITESSDLKHFKSRMLKILELYVLFLFTVGYHGNQNKKKSMQGKCLFF
jgi:hypothetical protein